MGDQDASRLLILCPGLTCVLKCAMTLRHCWDTWTVCCWRTGRGVSDCNHHIRRAHSRNLDSYRRGQRAGGGTERRSPAADGTASLTCVGGITKCRAAVSSVRYAEMFRRLRFQPESSHLQHAVNCACHHSLMISSSTLNEPTTLPLNFFIAPIHIYLVIKDVCEWWGGEEGWCSLLNKNVIFLFFAVFRNKMSCTNIPPNQNKVFKQKCTSEWRLCKWNAR